MARSMKQTIELGRKNAEQVRNVLEQNPDLPVIMITENGPDDYAWYYHEGVEASVDWLLFGEFCKDVPGIQFDKIYNDRDEAECDISIAICEGWIDCFKSKVNELEREFRTLGKPNRFHVEGNTITSDDLLDYIESSLNKSGWSVYNDVEEELGKLSDSLAHSISESLPWSKWVVIRAWL